MQSGRIYRIRYVAFWDKTETGRFYRIARCNLVGLPDCGMQSGRIYRICKFFAWSCCGDQGKHTPGGHTIDRPRSCLVSRIHIVNSQLWDTNHIYRIVCWNAEARIQTASKNLCDGSGRVNAVVSSNTKPVWIETLHFCPAKIIWLNRFTDQRLVTTSCATVRCNRNS